MTLGFPVRLNAETLIDLAERATQLSAGQWSLALLQAAYPQASRSHVLALPVGARDTYLLAARARLIAAPLRSEPLCDACGAQYELTLDPDDMGFDADTRLPDPEHREIRIGKHSVTLRPVCLSDLLAAEGIADTDEAAGFLARQVCGDASDALSLAELEQALEDIDPQADIWLNTQCPECSTEQTIAFDPVYFLAHEVRQIARQTLRDVVDIARAFHWSERDILALPESRRAYYVAEALA